MSKIKELEKKEDKSKLEEDIECVYFICDEKETIFKIGRSRDCEKRLKQLQTGNPHKLKIYKIIKSKNYREIELVLHALFAKNRMEGEWFNINARDVDNIIKLISLT